MGKTYYNRFFLTIAFAVALVVVIGSVRPEPISSVIKKEKFWADKVHGSAVYELVFAGDSRVYRGVNPEAVSRELNGKTVLNFGFSSAGFSEHLFGEIEKRLDKNADKPVIVLGITPYSLTPRAQENQHLLQEKQRPGNEVFERRYIRPWLHYFDPIKPEELINYQPDAPGYYEEFRDDGWVASRKIPSDPEAALTPYVKNFTGNRVSETVMKKLFQQVREWTKEGIAVFALRMPSTLKMEKLEDSISGFSEGIVIDGINRSGGIWIPAGDRYDYRSYDGSHLQRESASDFSSELGAAIKQELETP